MEDKFTIAQFRVVAIIRLNKSHYSLIAAVFLQNSELKGGKKQSLRCEADDFAGFPAGNIALIQRGTCTFQSKAENAAAAGAVGAIIFNQGNTTEPDCYDLFGGTLSEAYAGGIPVVSVSYPQGVEWSETSGLTMHMIADVTRRLATTYNVFADSKQGDRNNMVIAGAHLD
jgi:Zn-dependent M28 family amino/carboxypeptidase